MTSQKTRFLNTLLTVHISLLFEEVVRNIKISLCFLSETRQRWRIHVVAQ